MINCPKCGNPLQNGVSSCPVCGTNFVVSNVNTVNQGATQSAQPVVQNFTGSVSGQQSLQQPVRQPVQQVVQQPSSQTSAQSNAPVAKTVIQGQPMPNSSQSQNGSLGVKTVQVPTQNNNIGNQLNSKKSIKINNKMVLIVALVVIVVIAIVFLSGKNGSKKNIVTTQTLDLVNVVSNGFRFKMDKSWFVLAGNNVVIIKDDDSSIMIKLEKYDSSLGDYSKANIEKYLNSKDDLISEYEVSETTIESSSAIIAKAKVLEEEKRDAEYYYLKAGEKLIVGASVIYLKESDKSKNYEKVSALISSLSYSDDNSVALKEVNDHIKAFGVFGNILGRSNNWYDYEEENQTENNEDEEQQENEQNQEEQSQNEEQNQDEEQNDVNDEENNE